MSESVTSIEFRVTLEHDDGAETSYIIPGVEESVLPYVKSRIQSVNSGAASVVADMKRTFVTEGGASFVSIAAAKVIKTTEEVIYSG